MANTTAIDIGTFSKRVLLTGSGWTRNWGGQLASEMWGCLLGNRAVQQRPSVIELLHEESSFEAALGRLHAAPYTADDRRALESSLMDAFTSMDREIARSDQDPWINIYKVQELVFSFWGRRGDKVNSGYMFTLNQDLWPERFLYNHHATGSGPPRLPGVRMVPDLRIFGADLGPYNENFTLRVPEVPSSNLQLKNGFNIVKLHGSFNWRTIEGQNAMVVGNEKGAQIASFPLLAMYWKVFKAVLQSGNVLLMIVGYGFGDSHVNEEIAHAVEKHGLRLFVWDPSPELFDQIQGSPYGDLIWRGVMSTSNRRMIEVFPSNQAETEEYRRIRSTMFD
jgi:hypothetical protein